MTGVASPVDALWRQGELFASQREWKKSIECFSRVLEIEPENAAALLQLSYVSSLAGHYRDARHFAVEALNGKGLDPPSLLELAARLRTFNLCAELYALLRKLEPAERLPIPVLMAFGAQLSYLNDQPGALRLLDIACHADPDYPPALVARAQVLMYLGRFSEAEKDVTRCLRRAPEFAHAWWILSRLKNDVRSADRLAELRRQLARPNRTPLETAMLASAQHKMLDDLGDCSAAWASLEVACRAKRATLQYDAQESRDLVSSLIEAAPMPRKSSPPVSSDLGSRGRTPVFIVGMHRSGTTLLEQLLDGHSDVRGVGELYDFTSQMRMATDHHCRGVIDKTIAERSRSVDWSEVGTGYLRGMEWRLGQERYFTDKLPSNFLNIGFICQALPQARILHMVRDPVETCFSNLRELFSDANPYSYDQLELADFYAQYRRLMDHWHRAYPGRVLDVDYGELTRNPERVLREVCDFCGLDFEPGMMALQERKRGVATASAVQVREGIVARDTPKWAPYAAYLQPLIQALTAKGFIAHA